MSFVCLDGTPHVYKVIYDSMTDFFLTAPKTFSGYLIPAAGCDPATSRCGWGISDVSAISGCHLVATLVAVSTTRCV